MLVDPFGQAAAVEGFQRFLQRQFRLSEVALDALVLTHFALPVKEFEQVVLGAEGLAPGQVGLFFVAGAHGRQAQTLKGLGQASRPLLGRQHERASIKSAS